MYDIREYFKSFSRTQVGWPAASTSNENLADEYNGSFRTCPWPDLDEKENLDIYNEVLTKGA